MLPIFLRTQLYTYPMPTMLFVLFIRAQNNMHPRVFVHVETRFTLVKILNIAVMNACKSQSLHLTESLSTPPSTTFCVVQILIACHTCWHKRPNLTHLNK